MIPFLKAQGIGNDFVMVDALVVPQVVEAGPAWARALCDRRFGVGADGLLVRDVAENGLPRMRMWNPDGSESEMCGNGLRCFVRWLQALGELSVGGTQVVTGAGTLRAELVAEGRVRVEMGRARIHRGQIGMTGPAEETFVDQPVDERTIGTAVGMGNPHLVVFVEDVAKVDLPVEGARLEHHPLFPQRTNVHFVQPQPDGSLKMRIWERGAGATLACGTGACAVAVAGKLTGRSGESVKLQLPGGALFIEVSPELDVRMTGEAEIVYRGEWTGTIAR